MSNIHILYVGNNCTIDLSGLHNSVTGRPVADASVTVTLLNADGTTVAGSDWPQPMTQVPNANGTYRATLPYAMAIVAGARYMAHVVADAGNGLRAQWDLPCVGRERT